ncbi:MAG TPA: hypothetical protein VGR26_16815, partial [Acidimicrobiales bacterium]|nr:hypothetical protein [Acidimicrobiales bacterium]
MANLDEVKEFPQALAVFVALLGLVTVGHALALSPRRRRRELAVLRTLGFVRRQLGPARGPGDGSDRRRAGAGPPHRDRRRPERMGPG